MQMRLLRASDVDQSSLLGSNLTPFGAFPLRSVCVPLINRHMGRVYDVTHCYNLGKKMRSFILIKCLVTAFPHTNLDFRHTN